MNDLMPAMKDLVVDVRLCEGHLSHAAVTGEPKTRSAWHDDQHRLAVQRARSLITGARNSRLQGWKQVQEQVVGPSLDECTGDDWMIRPLADLRPPTATEAQIVLCKLPEASSLGDPTKLGLCAVTEVFRGARFKSTRKGSGESSRRMGQNRPACSSVPWASVAAVRLVPLTKVTDHQWAAAGITIPWTVDPLENVVAEVSLIVSWFGWRRQ